MISEKELRRVASEWKDSGYDIHGYLEEAADTIAKLHKKIKRLKEKEDNFYFQQGLIHALRKDE